SPSATTTIEGNQIPPPPPKFGGVINESVDDSKTWWPPRVVPPKGAPNILLIMTDDHVGFEPGPGDNPADLPRRKPDYCLNLGITWPGFVALESRIASPRSRSNRLVRSLPERPLARGWWATPDRAGRGTG